MQTILTREGRPNALQRKCFVYLLFHLAGVLHELNYNICRINSTKYYRTKGISRNLMNV